MENDFAHSTGLTRYKSLTLSKKEEQTYSEQKL